MLRQARATLITVALLSLFFSLFYYSSRDTVGSVWEHRFSATSNVPISLQCYSNSLEPPSESPLPLAQVLNGPPSTRYRDNLRNDTNYITSWSNAGFTNQFMSYVNMIYLGTITDRVPIIPPFAPDHHISSSAGIIPFGDIFDLAHLSQVLRSPIIEWRDVKKLPYHDPYSTSEIEELGCWSTRKLNASGPVRAENVVRHLGLDVAYTRVPPVTRLRRNPEENHVVLPHLAAAVYPLRPLVSSQNQPGFTPSSSGRNLSPDDQLTCFDLLYYATSGVDVYEWRFSWSPVWQSIAQHLRFTQPMLDLGQKYLRNVFKHQELPPFIAVHIRRGDFAFHCSKDKNPDCFPSVSVYKKHVDDVVAEIELKHRIKPETLRVLVMSDEVSPKFWEDVRKEGWFYINHTTERTLERFGEWYPPMIDIITQSFAVGFVGTDDSTFSLLGQRRVESWNDGVTRTVTL